jgi:hypothetical protein
MSVTDTLRQDVRSALRGLRKSPGFAIAALVTLSLGIGATSAIFSVVKAVLLTPLPYEAPEQRVMIWSKWVSFEKTWVASQEVFDYREFAQTLTAAAARRARHHRGGAGRHPRGRRRVDGADACGAWRHRSRLQSRSRPDDAGDHLGGEISHQRERGVSSTRCSRG